MSSRVVLGDCVLFFAQMLFRVGGGSKALDIVIRCGWGRLWMGKMVAGRSWMGWVDRGWEMGGGGVGGGVGGGGCTP